jgi:putative transposase
MPTYRRQHPHTTRRLDFWNYEGPGPYAITICTDHRRPVLGRIEDGETVLSLAGEIVKEEWAKTVLVRPGVTLDAYVIMPDHLHAILGLVPPVGDPAQRPRFERRPRSLGSLVAGFKGACTRRVLETRAVRAPLWQPNYNDRIIRSSKHLEDVRRYIQENPMRWWERHTG